MANSVTPGSFRSDDRGGHRPRTFFATDLVRRFGARAVLVIVVVALFAFAPLTLLYWFSELRCQTVAIAAVGQPVVVKPGRHKHEQEQDEAGDTALLQIICEVPGFSGYRELLCDEDPVRRDVQTSDSMFVRRERVYLRRAGYPQLPFGLLGKPPVSAWVPAGDYEVLVVHESQQAEPRLDSRAYTFPLISVFADCSLEARRKTVCRIPLPHYSWGSTEPIQLVGNDESTAGRTRSADELTAVLKACESVVPVPTPAGYVLSFGEPTVQHTDDHQHCVADLHKLDSVPREWTREQLASVRNWLPHDAQAARATLSQLVDRLQWREFLEGWFCYAAASIAGLVFTRWGAIAWLEPWRRRGASSESLALFVKIAIVAAVAWFLFSMLWRK